MNDLNVTKGYVYCFANESMPGLLKVGFTDRTVEERLYEANSSGTFGPPTDYFVIFAKFVMNAKIKEQSLHLLLSKYRINPKKEFFRISEDSLKVYFELMDGDWYHSLDLQNIQNKNNIETQFLNEKVFPSTNISECVTLKLLSECFSKWKMEKNIKNGSIQSVQKLIRETYGPSTVKGWTQFYLK
jgi:hypothetical protein